MPEKLIIGPDGQSLTHFGVKGMRWGVRKDRSSGGKGKLGDNPSGGQRAKDLKKQIRAKRMATFSSDLKTMQTAENKAYAKIDAALKKDISSLEAQSKGKLDRFVGTAALKGSANIDKFHVVDMVETKYISEQVKKREKYQKAKQKLDTKLANKWAERFDKEVKGKKFLEGLKALRKLDREMSEESVLAFLELELEHS